MTKIAERSQRLVKEFLERQASNPERRATPETFDPLNVGGAFLEMTRQMMANPARLVQAQVSLWQDYMALWQNATRRFLGGENKPVIGPAKDDRRFKDSAWDDNSLFDFIKQSYLLTARWIQNTVRHVAGLAEQRGIGRAPGRGKG